MLARFSNGRCLDRVLLGTAVLHMQVPATTCRVAPVPKVLRSILDPTLVSFGGFASDALTVVVQVAVRGVGERRGGRGAVGGEAPRRALLLAKAGSKLLIGAGHHSAVFTASPSEMNCAGEVEQAATRLKQDRRVHLNFWR